MNGAIFRFVMQGSRIMQPTQAAASDFFVLFALWLKIAFLSVLSVSPVVNSQPHLRPSPNRRGFSFRRWPTWGVYRS